MAAPNETDDESSAATPQRSARLLAWGVIAVALGATVSALGTVITPEPDLTYDARGTVIGLGVIAVVVGLGLLAVGIYRLASAVDYLVARTLAPEREGSPD